jgi:hypothetical protein
MTTQVGPTFSTRTVVKFLPKPSISSHTHLKERSLSGYTTDDDLLSTTSNKGRTDVSQTSTVQGIAVSTIHQFTATPTVITTQKFQDTGSQINLEKLRAQFGTFGLNNPEPERSDQHQLSKLLTPTSASKIKLT